MTNLSNYLFYITPIASAIPFLASLTIFFIPSPERYLKYFAGFVFMNFCMDAGTSYMALNRINNVFISNVNSVLLFTLELFLIREIVHSRKAKQIFLYFLVGYSLLSVVNFLLVQKTVVFNTMTYCLGCLLIVSACIYYFLELFQQRYSVNLVRQPAFWICSGLLFYNACSFPLQGLLNFMNTLPNVILENLFAIFILLNIFLYLSFTIAFLCRLRTRKSML